MTPTLLDLLKEAGTLARALSRIEPEATRIAQTPKREVARWNKARLFRYEPTKTQRLGPLLIVHGLVGRQSMVDLEPKRSMVRKLLDSGVDVWVMDWGNASRADRLRDSTDYADDGIGAAVGKVAAESGGRPALMGICQGGTLALCHAALHPDRLAGLALAIAPVDFHADQDDPDPTHGLLNAWIRGLSVELIDAFLEEHGNIPGRLTGAVFQNITPARTFAKYTTGLAALSEDEAKLATFLRMERWLADRPDHPGALAREWLIGLYHENRLAGGTFRIGGRPVRLDRIACPVLNIYGTGDHIVPPPCSTALGDLLPEDHDYQELAVPSGHVGVFVSRKGSEMVAPTVTGWLARIG